MPNPAVCPACAHDMCDHCTGPGCYCDCQIPGDPEPYDEDPGDLVLHEDSERPIDQIHCKDCGRPMIVWADIELQESDLTCARCKQGLAPEWEY